MENLRAQGQPGRMGVTDITKVGGLTQALGDFTQKALKLGEGTQDRAEGQDAGEGGERGGFALGAARLAVWTPDGDARQG